MTGTKSVLGPDSLSVRLDIPAHAALVDRGGTILVDSDRRSSVKFTIELLDLNGVRLEKEGTSIDIEVESHRIKVNADDVSNRRPTPGFSISGREADTDLTVVSDEKGVATFDLRGPVSGERLDTVTIQSDCCNLPAVSGGLE